MFDIGLTVLTWVLPIVLGPVVYVVARAALNASQRIDDLPSVVKRLVVLGIGAVAAAGCTALGLELPSDCAALLNGTDTTQIATACVGALGAPTIVKGATAGLVAMVVHAIKKSRPNT